MGAIKSKNKNKPVEIKEFSSKVNDNKVMIWNIDNFTCIRESQENRDVSVSCLIGADRLASAGSDTISIWELPEFNCSKTFEAHSGLINALLPLGEDHLASASDDTTIKIWNLNEFKCIKQLKCKRIVVCLVLISPKLMASGGSEGSISIWSLEDFSRLKIFRGHLNFIFSLSAVNETLLASGSGEKHISMWNLADFSHVRALEGPVGFVVCICTTKRFIFASGNYDSVVRVWKLGDFSPLFNLEGHKAEVYCLAAIKEHLLASGSADCTIRIWSLDTFTCLTKLGSERRMPIFSLHFDGDDKLISDESSNGVHMFRLWKLDNIAFEK